MMDLPHWVQRFFVTVWFGYGGAELSGIPLVGYLAAGLVAAVFGGSAPSTEGVSDE